MMCSSRITWKEDRMGLQSSTGGEKGMSTQGAAGKEEEMLTPGLASQHMDPLATRSEPTRSARHQARKQHVTLLMLTAPSSERFISLSGWGDGLIASSGDQSVARVRNSWRDLFSTLNHHNPVTCSKTLQTQWVLEMLMFPRRMKLYESLKQ